MSPQSIWSTSTPADDLAPIAPELPTSDGYHATTHRTCPLPSSRICRPVRARRRSPDRDERIRVSVGRRLSALGAVRSGVTRARPRVLFGPVPRGGRWLLVRLRTPMRAKIVIFPISNPQIILDRAGNASGHSYTGRRSRRCDHPTLGLEHVAPVVRGQRRRRVTVMVARISGTARS
jgi:hypothetical protein